MANSLLPGLKQAMIQDCFQPNLTQAGKSTDNSPAISQNQPVKVANGSPPAVEKIITDSDYQEYEKDSGKFDA